MDAEKVTAFMDRFWQDDVIPVLCEYIRIPNKSPAFDPDWQAHGHMHKATALFAEWAGNKLAQFDGAALEVVQLGQRTPLIFIDIKASAPNVGGTVLMYGHLDKQPEMTGWFEDSGPWQPRLKNERLYGRGGADDGYALFACISALLALKASGRAHGRCVIIIEACEESGSADLPFYMDRLGARIGVPDLVVCLDSGCGNFEQLWLTTSLRGMAMGNLTVRVLNEGVHSGAASGIVPSSFRILRTLLSRLEDQVTGRIIPPELHVQIPSERQEEAKTAAQILKDSLWLELPFAGATRPMRDDGAQLILERTWRPQLAVTAIAGYPLPENGGNVLLPYTTARLSLRLPPTLDAEKACARVKALLEDNPPYGAQIAFENASADDGWNAPALAPWLRVALDKAGHAFFSKPVAFQGEGGSIPFMAMLGRRFPQTQFVVTGVLGPHSNAHGPNEFLDIPMAKKLSAVIAWLLADHALKAQ